MSTFKLQLSQNGRTKVVALAVSTNLDRVLGPSAVLPQIPHAAPNPKPVSERAVAQTLDDNWTLFARARFSQ